MKIRKHLLLALSALLVIFSNSYSYAQDSIQATEMQELRARALSTPPKKVLIENSKHFPYAYDITIDLKELRAKRSVDPFTSDTSDITISLEKIQITNSKELQTTYGVVIDFPYRDSGLTATVVAYSSGQAILFTNSNFGELGGGRHKDIRNATKKLVNLSDKLSLDAALTEDFSYPSKEMVRIYLLTYHGTKVIEVKRSDLQSDKSKYSPIYKQVLDVLNKLQFSKEPD